MSTTIVICADGTGNTFGRKVSNVTELVKSLDLTNHGQQLAVYDQGIGTSRKRLAAVRSFQQERDPEALVILGVHESRWWPRSWIDRGRGLFTGYGLKNNVGEMYAALAKRYVDPDETPVFMFGFSRGAFTVRALAGLLHRCGLPPTGANAADRFEDAWDLYLPQPGQAEPLKPPPEAARFKEEGRDCEIHFLGLWDTVKSYGGVTPVMLPHLRHNPIVRNVRHALALDEERAWFKPTTWGCLDIDRDGAWKRIPEDDLAKIKADQEIREVWFRGNHSDIGGGGSTPRGETPRSTIALRWMLGEATAVAPALRLNDHESKRISAGDGDPVSVPGPSRPFPWPLLDRLRRTEIENRGVWPRLIDRLPEGRRALADTYRRSQITIHESAFAAFDAQGIAATPYATLTPPPAA